MSTTLEGKIRDLCEEAAEWGGESPILDRRDLASRLSVIPVTRRPGGDGFNLLLDLAEESYRASIAANFIDLTALVDALRDRGYHAEVRQSGGGCATLYAGPVEPDEVGDMRSAVTVGPGAFYGGDGSRWSRPFAPREDCSFGPDDEGKSDSQQVEPEDTIAQLADKVAALVDAVQRRRREAKAEAVRPRWLPPFGLSAAEAETLIRLGALACHEANRQASPYDAALASFSDPGDVQKLGARTWVRVESE